MPCTRRHFPARAPRRPFTLAALWPVAVPVALTWVAMPAQAQERGLTVTPTFSVQQTVTDNVDLSATDKQSEAITTVSPGVSVTARSGRVQGALSYSLNALVHARQSEKNTLQNALRASLNAEAIERHAFIDAEASISQQTVSAFGTQSTPTGLVNSNSTEVASLSISPSLVGNIGGIADVEARLNWSTSSSADTDLGDATDVSGELSARGQQGLFGWGLTATRQINDFEAGRRTAQDAVTASVTYAFDPSLQLTLRAGWEAQDVIGTERATSNTWGYGVGWQPTPRTSINLQTDRRFFGRSHSLSFSHRMKRSVWNYSDSRSISSGGGAGAGLRPLTLFDLFYSICVRETGDLAGCEPSTRNLLLSQGLNPDQVVVGGFLASALALQRNQTASFALTGQRTTLTLSVFRSESRRVDEVANVDDDLSSANAVRQRGLTMAVSHRLTPNMAVTLSASRQKTLDAETATSVLPGNEQRTVNLILTNTLGRRTSTSLTLRHAVADGETNPYVESAVIGSVSFRF